MTADRTSVVVIDNGEQLDLTWREAERLIAKGLIYRCPECGNDIAHLSPDKTMDEAVEGLN